MNKYKAKKVNGKRVDEHRLVMEEHLGRKLTKGEVVHHIDGIKANNHINNLMLFPNKRAHTMFHFLKGDYKSFPKENKKKLIDGELKCCKCEELKEINKFLTETKQHFGVKGICKECYSLQRKNRRRLAL